MRPMRIPLALVVFALAFGACERLDSGCRGTDSDPAVRGDALLSGGRTLDAIKAYEAALKLGASPRAERGLGLALAALRRWDDAHARLAPYAAGHPDDGSARLGLAVALIGRGELGAARSEIEALADRRPDLLGPQLFAAALARSEPDLRRALARLDRWQKHPGAKRDHLERPPAELLVVRGALLSALGDARAAAQMNDRAARAELASTREASWLAEAYLRAGQPSTAERLLAAVTAAEPKLGAAHRMLAEAALELRRPERAVAALDRVASQALPTDALLRARAELAMGERKAAIDRLRALVPELERGGRTGLAARARLTLARALMGQGEFEAARALLAAIDHASTEVDAQMTLAELELAREQPDAAITVLTALTTRQPGSTGAALLLATAYLDKGATAEAERVLRAYVQAHGDDPRGRHLLGTALEASGQREAARTQYQQALALAPDSAGPLLRLVALSDAAGDGAGAEALIRAQIARAPHSGALHRLLGQRLERRGEMEAAEAAFKASVEADDQPDAAFIALGEFYGRTDRPGRALELFEYVLRRAPNHPDALIRAAQMDKRLGNAARAVERYQKALAQRPRDVATQNNLALLLAEDAEQLDRALSLAKSAQAAAPDSPHVRDTLGWVHFRRGELEAARPLLERSAGELPHSAEAQHHLGMTLIADGQIGPGRKALERSLALDPHHPGATDARHALERTD